MSVLVVKMLENLLGRSCNLWPFAAISFHTTEGLPHMAFILRCYLALCIARYFINRSFSFTLALALLLQSFCLMGKHINKS